jgi:hypothetical protein
MDFLEAWPLQLGGRSRLHEFGNTGTTSVINSPPRGHQRRCSKPTKVTVLTKCCTRKPLVRAVVCRPRAHATSEAPDLIKE